MAVEKDKRNNLWFGDRSSLSGNIGGNQLIRGMGPVATDLKGRISHRPIVSNPDVAERKGIPTDPNPPTLDVGSLFPELNDQLVSPNITPNENDGCTFDANTSTVTIPSTFPVGQFAFWVFLLPANLIGVPFQLNIIGGGLLGAFQWLPCDKENLFGQGCFGLKVIDSLLYYTSEPWKIIWQTGPGIFGTGDILDGPEWDLNLDIA